MSKKSDSMKHARNDAVERIHHRGIEFIGGPYDGHKEPCLAGQTAHLPADVVWRVYGDAFRILEVERKPTWRIDH